MLVIRARQAVALTVGLAAIVALPGCSFVQVSRRDDIQGTSFLRPPKELVELPVGYIEGEGPPHKKLADRVIQRQKDLAPIQRERWELLAEANAKTLLRFYGREWMFNRPRTEHADERRPEVGLALSGGGMRSASFCTGVMAGLHEISIPTDESNHLSSLLEYVDVMSSVSGGGYTMSWFLSQQEFAGDSSTEFVKELFNPDGDYQKHLESHGRLLTQGNTGSWRYYMGATIDALATIVMIPVNFICNAFFNTRTNTSPIRRSYEFGISRTFNLVPQNDARGADRFLNDSSFLSSYFHVFRAKNRLSFGSLGSFAMRREGKNRGMPFFIVNMTSNIDDDIGHHTSRLKNLVFEMTPLGFGSNSYNYVKTELPKDGKKPGRDLFPVAFDRAIAISGAAADSNQVPGNFQRIALSALNFNLGYYIPNYNQNTSGVGTVLKEWMPFPLHFFVDGVAKDVTAPAIYLSDGGHSDNLGVFSLVRRMCGVIIVVDAERDPRYQFSGYRKLKRALLEEMGLTLSVPAIDRYLTHNVGGNPVEQGLRPLAETQPEFALLRSRERTLVAKTIPPGRSEVELAAGEAEVANPRAIEAGANSADPDPAVANDGTSSGEPVERSANRPASPDDPFEIPDPFDTTEPVMLGHVRWIPYAHLRHPDHDEENEASSGFDPTEWNAYEVVEHEANKKAARCYSDVELRVIYIKLSIDGHMLDTYPRSVIDYYRTHASTFPHQTTGDQNYPPEQFSAYRDLGRHIVRRAAERIESEITDSTVECVDCLFEDYKGASVEPNAALEESVESSTSGSVLTIPANPAQIAATKTARIQNQW